MLSTWQSSSKIKTQEWLLSVMFLWNIRSTKSRPSSLRFTLDNLQRLTSRIFRFCYLDLCKATPLLLSVFQDLNRYHVLFVPCFLAGWLQLSWSIERHLVYTKCSPSIFILSSPSRASKIFTWHQLRLLQSPFYMSLSLHSITFSHLK